MDSVIDKFAQRKNAQEMIRANAMAEEEERKKMAARLAEYEQALQEMRKCSLLNMENAERVKEALAASLQKIEEVQKREEDTPEKTVEEVQALLENLTWQMTKFAEEQQEWMAKFAENQHEQVTEILGNQHEQMTEILGNQHEQMTEILGNQREQMTEILGNQHEQMTEILGNQHEQVTELLENQQSRMAELIHASDEFDHKEAVKVYRNVQAVIEAELPKQTEEITAAIKKAVEKNKTSAVMTLLWVLTFAAAAANAALEVLKILGYL